MKTALEHKFIPQLITIQKPVAIFLVNGIKLTGYILAQDDQCLLLGSKVDQLVKKIEFPLFHN